MSSQFYDVISPHAHPLYVSSGHVVQTRTSALPQSKEEKKAPCLLYSVALLNSHLTNCTHLLVEHRKEDNGFSLQLILRMDFHLK